MRRLFIGVLGLILALALAGCRAVAAPAPEATRQTLRSVIGPDNVAVTIPARPNGTLIVAAHGHGGTVDEWQAGAEQAALREALLRAGYSIASSDGGGDVWGAPASVKAYENLYHWAAQKTGTKDLVLLGQSMGGLPALQLVGRVPATAFVGIYPVCNLATMTDKFPTFRQAWPDGAPASLSPVTPAYPAGFRALFFASPQDTTVPKATNTDACAAGATAAGADVTVVTARGEHGDPSEFQPARVVEFLNAR